MGIKTEVKRITPSVAEDMLKHNTQNRSVKKGTVEQYARDMTDGRWEKGNPEPIVFGENGILKDGQHRLLAIIKSGITLDMLVVTCDDRVNIFDAHAKRTVSDQAELRYGTKLNSTIAGAIRIKFTKNNSNLKMSDSEKIERYIREKDRWDKAHAYVSQGSSFSKNQTCCLAAFNALKCGVDEEQIRRFFEITNSGFSSTPEENVAILCRNAMLEWKGTRVMSNAVIWHRVGLLEEYIHLFVNRNTRKRQISEPTWFYTKQLEKKEGK